MLLQVRVYDFDDLYWRRDRERLPEDEWAALLGKILGEQRWILDGFPLSVTEEPLERADTVLFLDLPRRTSIFSVVRRELARRSRSSNGSAERARMFNDCFFRWIWVSRSPRPESSRALSGTGHNESLSFEAGGRSGASWAPWKKASHVPATTGIRPLIVAARGSAERAQCDRHGGAAARCELLPHVG
jgi:adenylate kinase family enzyme